MLCSVVLGDQRWSTGVGVWWEDFWWFRDGDKLGRLSVRFGVWIGGEWVVRVAQRM